MSKFLEKYSVDPVGDVVVLRRNAVEEKVGGIYIPDSAQANSQLATVMAVGPGKHDGTFRRTPQVTVGDTVLIDSICGLTVEIEGEKYVFCREPEILAILKTKG